MGNKLLVTGGTGFFGRALLRHFHSEAQRMPSGLPQEFSEVIVISRNPEKFAEKYKSLANAPWLRWVCADVCERQSLDALLQGEKIHAVLHAATDSTDSAAMSPTTKLDQIVNGTRNVLELAVRLKAQRFLLTSSGGVYGPQPEEMRQIHEDYCGMPDPLQISSTYGIGKRMAEHLCIIYGQANGIETVIARCFAFIGEDLPLDAHFAIGNFMRDALSSKVITVGGDGTPLRSYLDQRELAVWLNCLLLKGRSGQAYNVGSDQAISISDLAKLVRDKLAPDKKIQILGLSDVRQNRNIYVPDINKVKTELGLTVNITLADAIAHAVRRG
jgi:dTDP-glucose 4,6-dehydratase